MKTVRAAGGLPGQKTMLLDCKRIMDSIFERTDQEYDDATLEVIISEIQQIANRVFQAMPGGNPA